jgi:hypothetical protein
MPIGNFLEWLYARTYMEISSNYPELSAGNGDNFRNETFRNQEKLKF